MWLKVALLTLCLLFLFVLSRIMEATLFLESGIWSTTILDPVSLSVRQLKRILESRGICYSGVLEKQELTGLVSTSGQVMDGELKETLFEGLDEEGLVDPLLPDPSTHFTCGSHFYEEVEDTKDSAWLIQVVPEGMDTPLLDDLNWRLLVAKVQPFGIRTGLLDCHLDKRLCNQKKWNQPQVVLALPRGNHAKDSVVFRSVGGTARSEVAVGRWLRQQLNSRVHVVLSPEELEASWLSFKKGSDGDRYLAEATPKVRVLLLSDVAEPPLFFSALSCKFAGRVSFAIAKTGLLSEAAASTLPSLGRNGRPTFLVVTPEGVAVYGEQGGEHFNFRSFEFFLRTLQPEINDLFLVTLGATNLLVLMDVLVVKRGYRLWRHLVRCLLVLLKYNGALFLAWLSVLGLARFRVVEAASEQLLRLARSTATHWLTRLWWQDVRYWRSAPCFLFGVVLLSCSAYAYLRRRWFDCGDLPSSATSDTPEVEGGAERPASPTAPQQSGFSLDGYIMNCFFRPIAATLTGPADVDLAEFMLIEHLVTPNLWLRPVISNSSYVEDLPVWRYRCPNRADGADPEHPSPSCRSVVHRQPIRANEDEDEDYLSSCTSDGGGSTSAAEQSVDGATTKTSEPCSCRPSCSSSPRVLRPCRHHGHNQIADTEFQRVALRDRLFDILNSKYLALALMCRRIRNATHRRLFGRESASSSSRRGARRITNLVPEGVIASHMCAICLEPYVHRDVLCGLHCGHNYHHHCILSWLVRDNHHCPICRWPSYKRRPLLQSADLHQRVVVR